MNKLIAIVGMCGSGKSIVSAFLNKKVTKRSILGVSLWMN